MIGGPSCPVCGAERSEVFRTTIRGRYVARYLKCANCGHLGVDDPHWLPEAYSGGQALATVDSGTLARARSLAPRITVLFLSLFNRDAVFLDVGAGYGVLVRTMRDIGFDFRWEDPHAENLLARGFEYDGGRCMAVVAMEVIEHMADPLDFVSNTMARTAAKMLVFTTELLPKPVPSPDWWYLVPETGQHISFLERRTLDFIAARTGMYVRSRGNFHVFSYTRVPIYTFAVAATRLAGPAAAVLRWRMNSRTDSDNPLRR